MTRLPDCFADGNLRRTAPDMQKARNSLLIAERKLEESEKLFSSKLYNFVLISAYTSMFHAARSLLFKDGVKERSHFCLCLYVKEKYAGKIEARYLNELDVLREQRHRSLYGDDEVILKEVEEAEAQSAIGLARGFLESVRKLAV